MPEAGPKPRLASAINIRSVRIDTSAVVVYDGNISFSDTAGTTGTPHPLVNGLVLRAGKLRVWLVKTDQDCPLSAALIPADESGIYPGTAEGAPTLASGIYTWKFKWADQPGLGCNAVLRLSEIRTDGSIGATSNYAVNVLSDLTAELCPSLDLARGAPADAGDDSWT
jgi:hypothetical protein